MREEYFERYYKGETFTGAQKLVVMDSLHYAAFALGWTLKGIGKELIRPFVKWRGL